MVVEQPTRAVGDGHQLHRAATLGTTQGTSLGWLLKRLLGQPHAPAEITPDQPLHPLELDAAVLAGEAIVPQTLEVTRQGMLQEAAQELLLMPLGTFYFTE